MGVNPWGPEMKMGWGRLEGSVRGMLLMYGGEGPCQQCTWEQCTWELLKLMSVGKVTPHHVGDCVPPGFQNEEMSDGMMLRFWMAGVFPFENSGHVFSRGHSLCHRPNAHALLQLDVGLAWLKADVQRLLCSCYGWGRSQVVAQVFSYKSHTVSNC